MNSRMRFLSVINKITMRKYLALYFSLFIALSVMAQDIPDPMQPPRMVNDFSGLLDPADGERLEGKLREFYFQTSTQIYIVILDDLGGNEISQFAFLLGDKWGIGTKDKDNGAVILLNPSPDRMRGKAYIATGYGLEGAVPDAIANRIVDYDMVPWFKQQEYFEGLDAAVTTLMELTRGEYTADEYLQNRQAAQDQGPGIPAIAVIIFIVLVFSLAGRRRSARQYSAGHNIPFWLALFMVSGSRGSHRGSYGNFSSGSGGFGGFGGGGFGGGGGGSFGGGGAGGSW